MSEFAASVTVRACRTTPVTWLCLAVVVTGCVARYDVIKLAQCGPLTLSGIVIGESQRVAEPLPTISGYRSGTVLLNVVDTTGEPVTNLLAQLRSPSFSQAYTAESESPGVYIFSKVPAVEVQIRLSDGMCGGSTAQFVFAVAEDMQTPVALVVELERSVQPMVRVRRKR
jgi:hypothetical protein